MGLQEKRLKMPSDVLMGGIFGPRESMATKNSAHTVSRRYIVA